MYVCEGPNYSAETIFMRYLGVRNHVSLTIKFKKSREPVVKLSDSINKHTL